MARSLRQLADWLDTLPDQSLEGIHLSHQHLEGSRAALALNVSTLASLSRIDRGTWINFIQEHRFPIEVRSRDASRDILGKLLKFLEKEPGAVAYLQRRARSGIVASPELARALEALLKYPG